MELDRGSETGWRVANAEHVITKIEILLKTGNVDSESAKKVAVALGLVGWDRQPSDDDWRFVHYVSEIRTILATFVKEKQRKLNERTVQTYAALILDAAENLKKG